MILVRRLYAAHLNFYPVHSQGVSFDLSSGALVCRAVSSILLGGRCVSPKGWGIWYGVLGRQGLVCLAFFRLALLCLASPHIDVDSPAQKYLGKVQTDHDVDSGVVDTSPTIRLDKRLWLVGN